MSRQNAVSPSAAVSMTGTSPGAIATKTATKTAPKQANPSKVARGVMAPQQGAILFEPREFLKARAAIDGQDVFIEWTGSVYAMVPGRPQERLFNITGMNVARGIQDENGVWCLVTRELNYYTDPVSGELIHRWKNPWTEESLTVMHVANDPVQHQLRYPIPARQAGNSASFVLEMFPTYPNPLGNNPQFRDYSPSPDYMASEFFQITVPLDELQDSQRATVDTMTLAWNRIGPWLPWMKMGDLQGQLVYHAYGRRVSGYDELSPMLRQEIEQRLPKYRHAPDSFTQKINMTSWRYFEDNFDAYLEGDRFPINECV